MTAVPATAAPVQEPIAPAVAPAAAAPPREQGDGFAVQVAAVNVAQRSRRDREAPDVERYAAYVQCRRNGTGTVFRVRVGTFKTRREADTVAARLQKEEQFKPWVTR